MRSVGISPQSRTFFLQIKTFEFSVLKSNPNKSPKNPNAYLTTLRYLRRYMLSYNKSPCPSVRTDVYSQKPLNQLIQNFACRLGLVAFRFWKCFQIDIESHWPAGATGWLILNVPLSDKKCPLVRQKYPLVRQKCPLVRQNVPLSDKYQEINSNDILRNCVPLLQIILLP